AESCCSAMTPAPGRPTYDDPLHHRTGRPQRAHRRIPRSADDAHRHRSRPQHHRLPHHGPLHLAHHPPGLQTPRHLRIRPIPEPVDELPRHHGLPAALRLVHRHPDVRPAGDRTHHALGHPELTHPQRTEDPHLVPPRQPPGPDPVDPHQIRPLPLPPTANSHPARLSPRDRSHHP